MEVPLVLPLQTKILADTFHDCPTVGRELSMDGPKRGPRGPCDGADPPASPAQILPIRLTISMAVAAASLPLFPALVPARSMAC